MNASQAPHSVPFVRTIPSLQLALPVLATALLAAPVAQADSLGIESFENPAGSAETYAGNNYVGSFFADGNDYFALRNISLDPTPIGWDNVAGNPSALISNVAGLWAIVCEDVTDAANPLGAAGPAIIRTGNFDVSGKSNLQVRVRLGSHVAWNSSWEADDGVRIEYQFGNPNPLVAPTALSSAGYSVAGAFYGNGTSLGVNNGGFSDGPIRDDNGSGAWNAGETTAIPSDGSMQDFVFDIPGTGSDLSIQVVVVSTEGSEELVIDRIEVLGDPAVTAPPVLANIEAGAASFTEGGSAVPLSNTITVMDTDSTIASATVKIQGNNQPGEDVLSVNGALPSGISAASYNAATGTLAFSGAASPANYQAALRQVQYSNSSANPNVFLTRTVRFQAHDGTTASTTQDRNVMVMASIAEPQTIPYTEDFDTDGDGVRYSSNSFNDGLTTLADYFERTDANPHPGHQGGSYIFTAPQGGGYFACEDVASTPNPLGATQPGIVRLPALSSVGLGNLTVKVYLADLDNGTTFDGAETIEIQVAFDGNVGGVDLLGGTYTTVGRFVGFGPSGGLRQDTNLDGSSTDPADMGSPILSSTFTPYTFNIPGTGNVLSVQIVVTDNSGNEEIAFDQITVNGVNVGDPPVLANIEAAALSYSEGDGDTLITGTITATDGDDTHLESAKIQITTGFVPSEDVLSAVGGLPAGIAVGAFNAGDGSISLTGPALIADYVTAMRQVAYQNTASPNPNICDRTITFQINDGVSNSVVESRMVNITGTVASGSIPYLEDFDTDGDGARYTSNSFTNGGATPQDYFERTDDHPHPGQALLGGVSFIPPQGGGYWASEDVESAPNIKLGTHGIVRLAELEASTVKDIEVSLYLAEISAALEPGDKIEVQVAFDGNSGGTDLTAGTYTTIGRFMAHGSGTTLRQDTDLDGAISDAEDLASPELSATMTKFTFPVSGTGTTLSVQVKVTQDGGSEELAFDHIEVTGTEVIPPTADLADPVNAGSIVRVDLNARGYIEVIFTDADNGLDDATVTDAGAEFTLSGAPAAGVVVNGAGLAQGGGVFRYSFTGSFEVGAVGVHFLAGSFADQDSNLSVAETEGFEVGNSPPTLVDDTIERYPTGSVKVSVPELLSDDSDPEMNGPLTLTGVTYTGSTGGSVSFSGGWVFYTPGPGYLGDDTFTYTAEDSLGASSTAKVDVLIIVDNAASQNLSVTPPSGPNGDVTLRIVGIPGRTYTIQKMDVGDAPNWVFLDTVTINVLGQGSYVDPGPLPPTRLYRTVFP